MAEFPIMPVATDALLADTMHMTPEEFGCYCRLLFAMWRNGAWLSSSDEKLATICGVNRKRWAAIRATVIAPMKIDGERMTQKKLTQFWEKSQKLTMKRTTAARIRWKRSYDAQSPNLKMQTDMHMHNQMHIQMDEQKGITCNANHKPYPITNSSSEDSQSEIPKNANASDLATPPQSAAIIPPHAASKADLEAIFAAKRTNIV